MSNFATIKFSIDMPQAEAHKFLRRLNAGEVLTVAFEEAEDPFDVEVGAIQSAAAVAKHEITKGSMAQYGIPLLTFDPTPSPTAGNQIVPTWGGVLAGPVATTTTDWSSEYAADPLTVCLDAIEDCVSDARDTLDDVEEEVATTFARDTTIAQIAQVRIDNAFAHLTLLGSEIKLLRAAVGRA